MRGARTGSLPLPADRGIPRTKRGDWQTIRQLLPYLWQWKGGTFNGTSTSAHLNIFPIPGDELAANPNYNGQNNPGY